MAAIKPRDILEEIIAHKHLEVRKRKARIPARALSKSMYFYRDTISLVLELKMPDTSGIIAEYKRRSPSKGIINSSAKVEFTTSEYEIAGAAAVSVLTDKKYFGGSLKDLLLSRDSLYCPMLRKDFMIDEYQMLEAKAYGADIVLLIAACLSPKRLRQLAQFAKSLHLEVLLEIHTREELEHLCPEVDLIGINNRNLKNFEVNWENSIQLSAMLPADKPKIAESGIHDADTVLMLKKHGFDGFLIGELFMKERQPELALYRFIKEIEEKSLRQKR